MEDDFISRTPNGLFAESTIRDVDFIFHIEGKGDSNDITKLPDYIFYDSIISNFFDGKYEIKVEGGKTKLRSMIENFSSLYDGNSHIVFMDRDHDEMVSGGLITNDFVFYTLGYSYENDFWTSKVLKKVLSSLLAENPIIDSFICDWKKLERKIAFIHKFNLLSKVNGQQIFAFRGLCGITFEYKNGSFIIDPACVSRLKTEWDGIGVRSTQQTRATNKLLKSEFYSHPGYLIQGHAYESYALEAIHQLNGSCQMFGQNSKNFSIYKNIAFANFRKAPRNFMPTASINYYQDIFLYIRHV
ncbi:TPA: DUF4435 domain-containing protein [Escherichia albertii]|uniref:DUF4435 domain-containing protein n=1 Tax=Escherichia albertii TaxID=208962 RepID=UPI000C7FB808|nr:DUF4435 domain-containing protein [Escherichia albertii]MCV3219479.1 DUF4435 domain-containing protein [Escherichia albertii]MCV3225010.1 DUF4435 domain-containing protein [Escherichia albertii]MCV3236873.1 DUF4435 domain-containing protein [Escherichia albertii]MCV3245527.1 DUF4435 domain-containing protein [Escherichia albertii]MCV3260457.1 DUF4435 domain-containing protein [Escherichia albertii]